VKLYSPKTYDSTNRREKYIQQKSETEIDRHVTITYLMQTQGP